MQNTLPDIMYIKGVGEKRKDLLAKLDIFNFDDLLHFYPRGYHDFSSPIKICDIICEQTCCFRATVNLQVSEIKTKSAQVFKTVVSDDTGAVHITIFGSKYLADALIQDQEFLFLGKPTFKNGAIEVANPIFQPSENARLFIPIYHQTNGLSSKVISTIIQNALKKYSEVPSLEVLSKSMRQEFKLCHEFFALCNIHNPSSMEQLEIARKRLIFEELFVLLAGIQKMKNQSKAENRCVIKKDYSTQFASLLPFTMTGAQQRVIRECIKDFSGKFPMNRLVQGDVGCGKTAVSASLIYTMSQNNMQSALLAPTEILARQHFETFTKLFENTELKFALLCGSTTAKNKRLIKEQLSNGELDFVIGTHALLTDDVIFKNLSLVVTDEQHRFGVKQRNTLTQKGNNPHILVMSATPIPRTLSLIIYGDLDISIIDELPKGRQKIETYKVNSTYHARLYAFIKKHINEGRQAYIVCPLVEEGETELMSAAQYAKILSENDFKGYSIGLLHGKMKPKEKDKVMSEFASGKIKLLIATTVVEVGVDVPNSTIMVVENAERFGLSQLHQLRGRVGRGQHQSYCILVSDAKNEVSIARLKVMCQTSDGFKIADEDLKLRGPGDFFGSRQHGLPEMKIASLLDDMQILLECKKAVEKTFRNDPNLEKLENQQLKSKIKALFTKNGEVALN